jgi:multidrug resistance efflux pump
VAGCESLPGFGGGTEELSASGIIEATTVKVSSQQSGRVEAVYADQGDSVSSGDLLFELETATIDAQRKLAVADQKNAQQMYETAASALEVAQANLEMIRMNSAAATESARVDLVAVEQSLDQLYDNHEVSKSAAVQKIAEANRSLREARYLLDNFTIPISMQGMEAIQAAEEMKNRLDQAYQDFEPYKSRSSSDPVRKRLKEQLDDTQSDYDTATRWLEYETAVQAARSTLDKAVQDHEELQTGPEPDQVELLEQQISAIKTSIKQAEAQVLPTEAAVKQAETALSQAEAAIEQAQSHLELIDLQIDQFSINAPISGTVLNRSIEPGEILQAGTPAYVIGELGQLKLTVYIPEDRYGAISIGDTSSVIVDSFPGEIFSGRVVRIADEAEFTPRNVQTQEDRRTIVFAIEILVENPDQKLKPGMPADVAFYSDS